MVKIWVLYFFENSLKGMWKISLCFWLPKSPLCLEFLSAEPTPGNGLRVAVINSPPGHLNVGLKLNIQKTKIMISDPMTSWQIDGEIMETVTDFIFLSSKITVDGDCSHVDGGCSHEIKRHLLLAIKAVTNLDSLLKSRDITFLTKACLVKAMVFPVVMYGCESRTIKKAEC